jgi:hypothetical protein
VADQEQYEKRGVDVVGLVFGLGTLIAAAFMLSDGTIWPGDMDPRWVLASGAMVIGLGLLVGSLRKRR